MPGIETYWLRASVSTSTRLSRSAPVFWFGATSPAPRAPPPPTGLPTPRGGGGGARPPPVAEEGGRAGGGGLSRRYGGHTVQDVLDMETAPSDPLDALHTRTRDVIEQIVALLRGRTLYVSGAINMLDHPEFWNIDTTRELLRTFEQKERLADLMTALAGGEGLSVTIGEENPGAEMRECTLITSTYTYRDQVIGILGVVGPRRLPYPEVISIVNETARHVTDALSRVRQDLYLPS